MSDDEKEKPVFVKVLKVLGVILIVGLVLAALVFGTCLLMFRR